MTEASTIRRPGTPWTRSSASTTAAGSDPMRQVPTGWKMVVAMSPIAGQEIGVRGQGRTGQQLLRGVAAERSGAGEAAGLAHRDERDRPVAPLLR